MRQVTGRSSNNSTSKASIRLSSGGRFFSASTFEGMAADGGVDVIIDTARVTLIPEQMAGTTSPEQFLAITGQSPLADEVAVLSSAVDGKIAVLAVIKEALEALTTHFGENLQITSPLLDNRYSHGRAFAIEVNENICYLRLYDNGLKVAEAIEVENNDELLYYVANLLNLTQMGSDIPIYIIGSKKAYKLLKKYYTVICE